MAADPFVMRLISSSGTLPAVAIMRARLRMSGREFTNTLPPPAPRYDFHSRHAHLWGRSGPYLYSRDEVLADLGRFVVRARAAASGGGP